MKEYIGVLVFSALVCGALQILSPEGELKKNVKLLCGLVMLFAVISPIYSIVSSFAGGELDFGELFEAEIADESELLDVYNSNLLCESEKEASSRLKTMLIRDLSLDGEDFEVFLILEEEETKYVAKEVKMVLYQGGIKVDPHKVEDYIDRLLGCGCEIIYD